MDIGELVVSAPSSSLEGSKGQKRYRYRPPPGGGGSGSDGSLLPTQRDHVYDRDYDEDDEEEDVEDGYEDGDTCIHAAYLGHGLRGGGRGDSDVHSHSESTLMVNPSSTTATPAPSPSSVSFRSQSKATAPSPSSSSSSTAWGSIPAPYTVTAAAYVDPKSPRCRLSRPVNPPSLSYSILLFTTPFIM